MSSSSPQTPIAGNKIGTPLATLSIQPTPENADNNVLLPSPPSNFDIVSPSSNSTSEQPAARFKIVPLSNVESLSLSLGGGRTRDDDEMRATGEDGKSNAVLVKLQYAPADGGVLGGVKDTITSGRCFTFNQTAEEAIPVTLKACIDELEIIAGTGEGDADSAKKGIQTFWYDVVRGNVWPYLPQQEEVESSIPEVDPLPSTPTPSATASRRIVTTTVTEEFTILVPSQTVSSPSTSAFTSASTSTMEESEEAMIFSMLDVGSRESSVIAIPSVTPTDNPAGRSPTHIPSSHPVRTSTVFQTIETTVAAATIPPTAIPSSVTHVRSAASLPTESTARSSLTPETNPSFDSAKNAPSPDSSALAEDIPQDLSSDTLGLPPLPASEDSLLSKRNITSGQAVTFVRPYLIARYPKFFADNEILCDLSGLSATSTVSKTASDTATVDPAVLNQCLASLQTAEETATSEWTETEAVAYVLLCMQMAKLTTTLARSDQLVRCTHDGGIPGMEMAWQMPGNATMGMLGGEEDEWEWIEECVPVEDEAAAVEAVTFGALNMAVEVQATSQADNEEYPNHEYVTTDAGDIWPAPYYLRFRKE